ncbi:MAG TPA: MobF family relaxase [Solirubrobacteraceae bacterium]|jgi:conjugative relaxase-like TrwC/TraI family protein|nr:MobF family relaxase [Solirubrobacteraceae bacterium]
MQSTHKISGAAAAGFAAYLTASANRGDYYVGGELEGEGGAWHGSPEALDVLGLDSAQRVRRSELVSLMDGRSPQSGEPIRRVGGDGSRVAGVDLTFSAPKSVSALWAVSGPYRRAQIEVAHRRAVASALARVQREVPVVRRREDGVMRHEPARSLVAAEFVHTSSRLTRDQERDGVPDPQLHSHVVVLAAEREDGRFAAVDSRELFRSQRVNGAWYRAELAQGLRGLGLRLERRTGREGRFFEVVGIPDPLVKRWSRRTEVIERAAREFRDRYGRAPRAGELAGMSVSTRGTKTVIAEVDVSAAWRAVGEEHGLESGRAEQLFESRAPEREVDVRGELLGELVAQRSMVTRQELEARALEVAAGVEPAAQASAHLEELSREGELVELDGGWWTTRELRELEQRTLATVLERSAETAAVPSPLARGEAAERAGERVGGSLSDEQQRALEVVTGPGGVTVLVGEAGTGKGVVLGAAREAWEREGHRVIGTSVAGSAAQRLGVEAGFSETMTADALAHRVREERLVLDSRSVVVFDEAGMADTRRLAQIVELTREADAKLVLAGDQAQLSSIGAGGLFSEIAERAPTARLTEVHRANHEWERQAWGRLRDGDAQTALAAYQARGHLHIEETREEAGETMVSDWAAAHQAHPGERVVMITDASNHELDRLNQHAQEQRAAAGELGDERVQLPERPYGLAHGDEILFAKQHRVSGQQRVENGTRAVVVDVDERTSGVRVRTEEQPPREIDMKTEDLDGLRLAYAQHVYKAQGLTADRALVLTGGWQTDRERAYVALSRGREQTDVYVAREDLGHQGIDSDAIARLAERMSESRAQQASITRAQIEPTNDEPAQSRFAERLRAALDQRPEPAVDRSRQSDPVDQPRSRFAQQLHDALNHQRDHTLDHDRGEAIET